MKDSVGLIKDTGKCATEKYWIWENAQCFCEGGWIRIGKDDTFSDWIAIDTLPKYVKHHPIDCNTKVLHYDPLPGVRKSCYCGRAHVAAEETVEEALSDVEMQSFVAKPEETVLESENERLRASNKALREALEQMQHE